MVLLEIGLQQGTPPIQLRLQQAPRGHVGNQWKRVLAQAEHLRAHQQMHVGPFAHAESRAGTVGHPVDLQGGVALGGGGVVEDHDSLVRRDQQPREVVRRFLGDPVYIKEQGRVSARDVDGDGVSLDGVDRAGRQDAALQQVVPVRDLRVPGVRDRGGRLDQVRQEGVRVAFREIAYLSKRSLHFVKKIMMQPTRSLDSAPKLAHLWKSDRNAVRNALKGTA